MRRQVHPSENYPLVLVFKEPVNQALFMMKFLEYQKTISNQVSSNLKKILIFYQKNENYNIPIISSIPSSLQKTNKALYRIMYKLRKYFNLKQRVPVIEDNLRKNFSFWLEIASSKLEKGVVFDSKINLIIESIEKQQEDDSNKINLIKYWLPRTFPNRVNCIVTTKEGSSADEYFQKVKCHKVYVESKKNQAEVYFESVFNYKCFNEFNENIANCYKNDLGLYLKEDLAFTKKFFQLLLHRQVSKNMKITSTKQEEESPEALKQKMAKKKLEAKNTKMVNHFIQRIVKLDSLSLIRNTQDLINHIIERVASVSSRVSSDNPVDKDIIINYFIYLTLTKTGLTVEEIKKLTLMTSKQLKLINLYFAPFLTNFEGYYKLIDSDFIEYTNKMYSDDQVEFFYKNIADALDDQENTVRKIDEQTFAYIHAKEYFTVKQILSSIENFLVFFNAHNKLDLYSHWNTLIKQTYDPVIEYNKSLELFEMHCQPKPNDLFTIVIQLSRFFVDLADFEDHDIPEFRHPKIINRLLTIKGNIIHQRKTENLNDESSEDDFDMNPDKVEDENHFVQEEMRLNASDFSIEEHDSEIEDHNLGNTVNYLEDIGLLKELKRLGLYQKDQGYSDILKGYEQYSVDVPYGYQLYMKTFKEMIVHNKERTQIKVEEDNLEYMFNIYNEEKKTQHNIFQENNEGGTNDEAKDDPSKQGHEHLGNDLNLAINPKKERSFYYYKRWIWLIFPWACISADNGYKYSNVIKKCYSNEHKCIRVKDEEKRTRKALAISVDAKLKRRMILHSKKRDYLINPSSLQQDKNSSKSTFGKKKGGMSSTDVGRSGLKSKLRASCKFKTTSIPNSNIFQQALHT